MGLSEDAAAIVAASLAATELRLRGINRPGVIGRDDARRDVLAAFRERRDMAASGAIFHDPPPI